MKTYTLKYHLIFFLFLSTFQIFSQQDKTGSIHGKIYDAITGNAILGANVTILHLNQTIQTNENGEFIFRFIPVGKYKIRGGIEGYDEAVLNVMVNKDISSDLIFRLIPQNLDDKRTFYIGGIEVTANMLPDNPSISTTTTLSSGEIEHLQASNLGDILQLIPGVQTINPSLDETKQATIRQINIDPTAKNVSSLGTQIIIDDVPLSNNANMQGDLGQIISTAGSGIDLRMVPADNIDFVEVIRGVPSARYGDLAGGAIKVTTSKKLQPNRLKFKYNPDTQELNYSGGVEIIDALWNYNLNVARSIRDVRLEGDSYTRLNGQLFITHNLNKKWNLQHKILFNRIFDEFAETDDPFLNRQAHYNREYSFQYSLNSQTKFTEFTILDIISSIQYTNQDSYYQEEITRDNSIFSTRLNRGTQEGVFVGGVYFTKYWTKGTPVLWFFNSELKSKFSFESFENNILTGVNLRFEKNYGEGKVFNPLYPPRFAQNHGDRPRKYESIPGQFLFSAFIIDKISGSLFFPFQLELGLRYELFDPQGLLKARHGQYLNPRLNLQVFISKENILRFGYGISCKAPTLNQLYPNPRYFDVIDTSYYNVDPSKRFSLVSTYIVDITNPNLKGFTQKTFEAGYDLNLINWKFSTSAYYNKTTNGLNMLSIPYYLAKYSRPNWPEIEGSFPKDTGVTNLLASVNNRYIFNKGIEFTIISPTIYFLNGRLQIDAAYTQTETGQTDGVIYNIDYIGNATKQFFYTPKKYWADQFLISYRLTAASQILGLWFTLTLQQMVLDRDKYLNLDETKYPLGYVDKNGKTVLLTESEKRSDEYKKYVKNYEPYEYLTEDRPNKFLINIRVSKSLFSGAEVSFFVNNFLNDKARYAIQRTSQPGLSYTSLNIPLYYGIEFSSIIDKLFK